MPSPPLLPRIRLRNGDPNDLMREIIALMRTFEWTGDEIFLELHADDDAVSALIRMGSYYPPNFRPLLEQTNEILRRYGARPWDFNISLEEWHHFDRLPIPLTALRTDRSAREMLDLVPKIPPGQGGFVVVTKGNSGPTSS